MNRRGTIATGRRRRPRTGLSLAVAAAAAAACLASAGHARASSIRMFPLPSADSGLAHITAGPDGALWFTEANAFKVGRITTAGQISEIPIAPQAYDGDSGTGPDEIVSGGGALWTLSDVGSTFYRVTTTGTASLIFQDLHDNADNIAPDDQGGVWATTGHGLEDDGLGDALRRVQPSGAHQDYPATYGDLITPVPLVAGAGGTAWYADDGASLKQVDDAGAQLNHPITSPDPASDVSAVAFDRAGDAWFTEYDPGSAFFPDTGGAIGVVRAGSLTGAARPAVAGTERNTVPHSLVRGPDGAMYFSWADGIGRIDPASGQVQYADIKPHVANDIAFGSDGALWFLDTGANQIGRIASPASSLFGAHPAPVGKLPLAPAAKLIVPRQRLGAVRRRGRLRATCTLAAAGTCAVAATLPASTARHLQLEVAPKAKTYGLTAASKRLAKPGRARLTLRLRANGRRALKHAKSVKLTLHLTSSARGRRPRMSHTTVTLRR